MSTTHLQEVDLASPVNQLTVRGYENYNDLDSEVGKTLTRYPELYRNTHALVRLADVRKLVEDLTRSQPSTGKADGWEMLEAVLDIYDDYQRPYEHRAYAECTISQVFEDARTALLWNKAAVTASQPPAPESKPVGL